ncbi:hypothetical protein HK102_010397 [Quaeritorhiza haematococci]|nr:hypothetical protein HK102_010397 [Quaeritorhiza haematococci]
MKARERQRVRAVNAAAKAGGKRIFSGAGNKNSNVAAEPGTMGGMLRSTSGEKKKQQKQQHETWDDDFDFEENGADGGGADCGSIGSLASLAIRIPASVRSSQMSVKSDSQQLRKFAWHIEDIARALSTDRPEALSRLQRQYASDIEQVEVLLDLADHVDDDTATTSSNTQNLGGKNGVEAGQKHLRVLAEIISAAGGSGVGGGSSGDGGVAATGGLVMSTPLTTFQDLAKLGGAGGGGTQGIDAATGVSSQDDDSFCWDVDDDDDQETPKDRKTTLHQYHHLLPPLPKKNPSSSSSSSLSPPPSSSQSTSPSASSSSQNIHMKSGPSPSSSASMNAAKTTEEMIQSVLSSRAKLEFGVVMMPILIRRLGPLKQRIYAYLSEMREMVVQG